jgi:hypothetical protein
VRLFIPLLATLAFSPAALAADQPVSLSYGLDYSTGTYGGSDTTETWSMPLSLKYQRGAWAYRLGTSYLWTRGTQSVTPEGEPLPGGGTVETTQGYGDVTASVSMSVLEMDEDSLGGDVTGKIKFGTASARKALGTGENDYALQLSLYRAFDAWMPYLDVGYRWKGDPAGLDYANVWSATLGTSYQINKRSSLGMDYAWRERLTATGAAISEATLYLNHKLSADVRLNVYGVAGFSDASPDWETGLMLTQRY